MVSAFSTENGVVLGQVKTEAKSNNITAIPELLNLLDLKKCLITIDAMGCQKDIASKIKEKKRIIFLQLKVNRGNYIRHPKKDFRYLCFQIMKVIHLAHRK
ncbi:Transposase [Salmonella enterica]|nr:Transposase [Salmonella enterica]